jgi:hypothetical protein
MPLPPLITGARHWSPEHRGQPKTYRPRDVPARTLIPAVDAADAQAAWDVAAILSKLLSGQLLFGKTIR